MSNEESDAFQLLRLEPCFDAAVANEVKHSQASLNLLQFSF